MDVRDAVASRFSCRAFLPTPVPESIIREIVEQAARAPSAGNMQPWRVYALTGKHIEALKVELASRADEFPLGEGAKLPSLPYTYGGAVSVAAFRSRGTIV